MTVGIIEHNSSTNREYIYMLSPRPDLKLVGQDYLTNLYHLAWLMNALNDRHIVPEKFGIHDPLAWLAHHSAQTTNQILAIDDHFQFNLIHSKPNDRLSRLYENLVSHRRRHLLSNFDVR